mgnify:CR=1 FL=1
MKTNYQIELADNGMIVRRNDIGCVNVFEYLEEEHYHNIGRWLGMDILDDMLESPEIKDEIKNFMKCNTGDGVNHFEIIVEIKPVIK